MKKLLTYFFLCLTMGVLISCNDINQPKRSLEIDAVLKTIFEEYKLMGMSVIMIANNEIAYEGYFGNAIHESQTPLNNQSIFRIASITKTVSAIALMQLWEQGMVDLDTDVSDYLGWNLNNPQFPDDTITLRMLMGHTSSIRDGESYPAFSGDMIDHQLHLKELFEQGGSYYSDDMFADQAPGDFFSYSNAAWGVLASVVEIISGQRFDKYAMENIFEPLGIRASFNATDFLANEFAALYRYQNNQWIPQVDFYVESNPEERAYSDYMPGTNGLIYGPQGSLRASAPAVAELGLLLLNGGNINGVKIIEKSTLDEMVHENWMYNGSNGDTWDDFWISFGLGIHRITNTPGKDVIFPDRQMIGHAGIAYGLLSDMYVDPETGSGVVFITNGSQLDYVYAESSAFYEVEDAVFDALHPFLLELESN